MITKLCLTFSGIWNWSAIWWRFPVAAGVRLHHRYFISHFQHESSGVAERRLKIAACYAQFFSPWPTKINDMLSRVPYGNYKLND